MVVHFKQCVAVGIEWKKRALPVGDEKSSLVLNGHGVVLQGGADADETELESAADGDRSKALRFGLVEESLSNEAKASHVSRRTGLTFGAGAGGGTVSFDAGETTQEGCAEKSGAEGEDKRAGICKRHGPSSSQRPYQRRSYTDMREHG